MKKYFVSAGHFDGDTAGTVVGNIKEWQETIKVADALVAMPAPEGSVWVRLPDNLNLKQTIAWIKERAAPQNFCLEIHFNGSTILSIRGTEAYYHDTPEIAEVFARNVSRALSIPNRGAIHDSHTAVGSLGFLRQLPCKAVLVECLYLSNKDDREAYIPVNAAVGLYNAINELSEPVIRRKVFILTTLIGLMRKLLELLQKRSG